MKKSRLLSAVSAFIVSLLVSLSANAALLQFVFEGTANQAITNSTIGASDSLSIAFILDTDTPSSGSGTGFTNYLNAMTIQNIAVDGIVPTPSSPIPIQATVFDTGTSDQLTLQFNFDATQTPFSAASGFAQWQFVYSSNTNSLFTGTDLSTLDLDVLNTLSPFSQLFISGSQGSSVISLSEASFSVVPIPPALWLFGSGLLGLIGLSRRKRSA